jgi:hypothetical protein
MDLTERFMELKQKKADVEKNIMEANVRLESLQGLLLEAMQVLKDVYNVDTLEQAKELLNQKNLEYTAILNQLDAKLKEYEDLTN